ncbi:BORG1 protein, partial [Sterrhoptilus dennistouni]|nr:BORG1 protein [Sterrhoptilus dennistouni]
MSTKVPIYLKRGSRKGKKEKLRDLLSSDMISPPLGDFRHTIHIGSGGQGDTFGDISFLQGKFHLLPHGDGPGEAPFGFSRTATGSGAEVATTPSPLLKNAISLPALGGSQALTLPVAAAAAAAAPPKPPRLHLDETPTMSPAMSPTMSPRCPRATNGDTEPLALSQAGSLLSLHVDLGPSILEDVLQVMDRHQLLT